MENNLKPLIDVAGGKIIASLDERDRMLTEEESSRSIAVVKMALSMATASGLREGDLLEVLKVSGLNDRAQKITAYRVGVFLASKILKGGDIA